MHCLENNSLANELFDGPAAAKLMWFEWMYSWLSFLERNVIYPAVFMSGLTTGFQDIVVKFGPRFKTLFSHSVGVYAK